MKLKKIVENMDRMPSTLRGFNETPKLTAEQKNKLMDMVGHYNELGKKLKMEQSLIETATALSEISELAETYACNEASDWFATEVVKKDFKRARNISGDFQKIAKECHGRIQQLNALYEDMGHILGRYYEIADPMMQEVMPNPADLKSQMGLPNANPQVVEPGKGTTVMQEVSPNDKNLQSQRRLPANGPIKEVAVDDMNKNIKSQRNKPAGGPAPAQVKEVAVDDKHANIKSQRDLPHTGGPATPQIKEVHPNDKNIKSQRTLPSGGPAPAQVKEVAVDDKNKNIKSQRDLPSGGPAPAQVKETALNTVHQTCKVPGCGRPVQRTLSAELCPIHASPKAVNVKEVAVDAKHANIKSQRDLPAGGPTAYNPPKDPKDTGSIKEVAPVGWEKTVKAMKGHKEIDNPRALAHWMKGKGMKSHKEESVNEVNPNDKNIQSQRELPQGGPTPYKNPNPENPSAPVKTAVAGKGPGQGDTTPRMEETKKEEESIDKIKISFKEEKFPSLGQIMGLKK